MIQYVLLCIYLYITVFHSQALEAFIVLRQLKRAYYLWRNVSKYFVKIATLLRSIFDLEKILSFTLPGYLYLA